MYLKPLIYNIIPLYNIYSTYIEIWLVETIPRDIYENIVFPSQQYRISLIQNSQDLTLWSYNGITPEMFRNINFVNKDGQQISFGRFHQNVGMVEKNIHFPCISEIWKCVHPRNSHISLGRCLREIWFFSGVQIFISPLCTGNKCIKLNNQNTYNSYELIFFHDIIGLK